MNSSISRNYTYSRNPSLIEALFNTDSGAGVWMLIALMLAIIGGILVYFLFVKNKTEFKGFWAKLRTFLSFRTNVVEPILKIAYYVCAIFITLTSFNLISTSFLAFLLTLVIGNLTFRITFELMLMGIRLCRNVAEINDKIKK